MDELKLNVHLDYHKSAAGAAKKAYKVIREASLAAGQNPDIETALWSPKESEKMGYGKQWTVCWESGPYEWAIIATYDVPPHASGWFAEPYNSHILCFNKG